MLKDGCYYPSDEDRSVFKRIIAAVRLNPDWFTPSATALDRDYSTQAIRNRIAAELREHRSIPDHIKRSRAFERKHCQHDALSQQLGFTVTPSDVIQSPPMRLKGADGKPQQPVIELFIRFALAFHDGFEREIDFDVHELQEGLDIAARRVLLAWLWRDPNRGTVQSITEFQELRNKPTEDGIAPLWIPDDAELPKWDKSRFIRQDGGTERDAAAWIKKAHDAIDFLGSQAQVSSIPTRSNAPQKAAKVPLDHAEPKNSFRTRHHAEHKIMSFPKLAQRFRDLANRQPPPAVEAAVLELSRLKAQGMRKWFLARLSPTPVELWSWYEAERDRLHGLSLTPADNPSLDSAASDSASDSFPSYDGPTVDHETMEVVRRGGGREDAFPEIWESLWEILVRYLLPRHLTTDPRRRTAHPGAGSIP